MTETHAISALSDKYAELSGKLKACDREAIALKTAMSHLQEAMKILDPSYDTKAIAPRRQYRRNPHFKKGNYLRVTLDILREADRPLSSRELAGLALQRQGVTDTHDIEQLKASLHASLTKCAKEGRIVSSNEGRMKLWSIGVA